MDPDAYITLTIRRSTLAYLAPVLMAVPNVGGFLSYLRADDAVDAGKAAVAMSTDARDTADSALTWAIDPDDVCAKWVQEKLSP